MEVQELIFAVHPGMTDHLMVKGVCETSNHHSIHVHCLYKFD